METIQETGKDIVGGLKKVPSKNTLWMVAGATAGLIIGVMAMSAWFADKPSLTTYLLPNVPQPGMMTPVPAVTEQVAESQGGY